MDSNQERGIKGKEGYNQVMSRWEIIETRVNVVKMEHSQKQSVRNRNE